MISTKAPTKIDLFKELSQYQEDTGVSNVVSVDQFTDKYAGLNTGNGGGWCRLDGDFGRKYKVCIAKKSGELRFSWQETEEEKELFGNEMRAFPGANFTKGTAIYLLKICGNSDRSSARPIRQDIRAALKDGPCVSCGSTSQIEIDHKNGLYNDPRVLSAETQDISDFQPLCKHCNDQKRQTYNYTKTTGRRYPATMIPMLRPFGIAYVEGTDGFNPEDPNATVGTYWHDPIHFMSEISQMLKNK